MSARQSTLALADPVQPLPARRPEALRRAAVLSDDGACRFTLERHWLPEGPLLLYAGLNPSTADHLRDDPSVAAWTFFGRAWDFAGFVAVNPIPKRSPSPLLARDWYERGINRIERDRILNENACHIRDAAKRCVRVCVCWGAATWLTPDIMDRFYGAVKAAGHTELYCFGRNGDGSPIHPMARGRNRIRRDAEMQIWRAA